MDTAESRRAAIREVGERLLARNAELVSGMTRRIVAEVPAYRRASRAVLDDVTELATATAGALSRALADDVQVARGDVPILGDHAARRVHQGVGLDAFLHAYRAALFGYWDACVAESAVLDVSRDTGLAVARFVLDAIDTITTHAAEAYLREEARVHTQSGREARDLIERLLRGQHVDDDRRHPAAPGLDPTGPLAVVVGRVERSDGTVGAALQAAREALEDSMALGTARPLIAIREGEIVLVAAGGAAGEHTAGRLRMARRRALDEQAVEVRYGVGLPAEGFAGVHRAYQEAALALSYTSTARPTVALAELPSLACALIGADATTRAVIASKGAGLRALGDDERAAATHTIRAFARADLNVARAAAGLHVHPNTMRYRLARIATTTGHDPRTFDGLVELLCIAEVTGKGVGRGDQPGDDDAWSASGDRGRPISSARAARR